MRNKARSARSDVLRERRSLACTKRRRRSVWTLCLVALAVGLVAASAMAQPGVTAAPLRNESVRNRIPDRYIVVFKAGTTRAAVQSAQDVVKRSGGTILFTYTAALTGFNAMIPAAALPAVRAVPGIDFIEADQMMRAQTSQPPNPNFTPPFGIDRIDQRLIVPNGLNGKYTYSETGAGVNVYVIDSGIYTAHTDFGGRAKWGVGADFSGETPANTDCVGHGTHVAGVIGGLRYGVAKGVTLYAVRVLDCNGGAPAGVVTQGVDWVMNNATKPAVANISVGGGDTSAIGAPALTMAVNNLVNAGVTVVVAAGNNADKACNYTPADAANAIVVGTTNPFTDQLDSNSNYGPCLKLFAPGVNIESAVPDNAVPATCTLGSTTPLARSATCDGTSVAAPHVAGVAARYLQTNPMASPADVWNAIHAADDVASTMGWGGIPGATLTSSPNELLHWGSLNNGQNDGDPHFLTVDGIKYDFQGAGEFVVLRDGNGLEIQTRQTPVATAPPAASAHTGLATCVSVNTAVAARVGGRRVTYQPTYDGDTASADLQLRVDGKPTKLPADGLDLGPGGRVIPLAVGKGVIEIDFPDGTNLVVTPGYWQPQHTPYLDVDVYNTTATEGLMGAIASDSWLPALPNGTSVGPLPTPMPGASHQRFVTLYQTFGKAWRVTNATTLFDYAAGTSTASFTDPNWPPENPPCMVPGHTAPQPLDPKVAQRLCSAITGANRKADCIFDTAITADPGFAKTYLISQLVEARATTTTLNDSRDQTQLGEVAIFTATVRMTASRQVVTNGTVQFVIDGANVGRPIKLDAKGQAVLRSADFEVGQRHVVAVFAPAKGSALLASRSFDRPHTVVAKRD